MVLSNEELGRPPAVGNSPGLACRTQGNQCFQRKDAHRWMFVTKYKKLDVAAHPCNRNTFERLRQEDGGKLEATLAIKK